MSVTEQAEHARVGRPRGQHLHRFGAPGLAQRRQQPGHAALVPRAEELTGVQGRLAAGAACHHPGGQRVQRLGGSRLVQRPQQPRQVRGAGQPDLPGDPDDQGAGGGGVGIAQHPEQLGDVPLVPEAHAADQVAGQQDADRVTCPRGMECFQPGQVPRLVTGVNRSGTSTTPP
jgi:hypothetical protein